jgi:eukaryotic-like serine/threonine-protein kinase
MDDFAQARVGSVLRGKYRLDRVLGVGGMGAVYAATHRNRKRFAIKMLHPEYSGSEEVRTRFLREGYVANSVEHRGAVAVLDDDVAEDGSAFLVMELLEGAGLDAIADRRGGALPLGAVFAIGDQLLEVLSAAHQNGIVHRDLKPANLFLTRGGELKVLDFGIARLRDATQLKLTQTGAALGTPAFMAPEQALGKTAELDARVDVFAAGATLFVLISGQLVHEGESMQHMLINAATKPVRPLASAALGVTPALASVVDRALAFDKAARWQSAAAMREALLEAHRSVFGRALLDAPEFLRAELFGEAPALAPALAEPLSAARAQPASVPAPERTAAPGAPTVAEPLPAARAQPASVPTPAPRAAASGQRGPMIVAALALCVALAVGSAVLLMQFMDKGAAMRRAAAMRGDKAAAAAPVRSPVEAPSGENAPAAARGDARSANAAARGDARGQNAPAAAQGEARSANAPAAARSADGPAAVGGEDVRAAAPGAATTRAPKGVPSEGGDTNPVPAASPAPSGAETTPPGSAKRGAGLPPIAASPQPTQASPPPQPSAAAERPVAAPSAASPADGKALGAACARMLERLSLGEELSPQEKAQFARCRK